MRFRPCIDLHDGKVKQIVGSTLKTNDASDGDAAPLPAENFVSDAPASHYAKQYREDRLPGGHVIMLGPGNEEAALAALAEYPGGLQIGGGVTPANARCYLDAGASHVIVTSYVFRDGSIDMARLAELVAAVGADRLVLDLSCRRRPGGGEGGGEGDGERYYVVTDKWQKFTDYEVSRANLEALGSSCAEFLVHGVDVEGKRCGIEEELVRRLGAWAPRPVTYAGGATSLADLERVRALGGGNVDLTIGSALDLFGGDIPHADAVAWQRGQEAAAATGGQAAV